MAINVLLGTIFFHESMDNVLTLGVHDYSDQLHIRVLVSAYYGGSLKMNLQLILFLQNE